jgi:LytS/YehU family sensor histidine kinase
MKSVKFLKLVLPHVLGWGVIILIILLQSKPDDFDSTFVNGLVTLFASVGTAAYINLYVLMPRYLFKKKYKEYVAFIAVVILLSAASITYFFVESDEMSTISRYVISIINVVFFLFISSGYKLFLEYLKKQFTIREIENKQLRDEISLLKAQVNPHFLFNTLNNLYGLINQNQNQQASDVTLKLADLMRYLLESSKSDVVSLNKEIQFLEDYLSLEKIRLSQQTDIKFTISGLNKELFVAPLLFIPLVENTFKHGLNTISVDSYAHFSLSVQDNELFFEAVNSVGKSPENSEKSGTGLENLKKRLQLIYPDKHQLDIEQTSNQFKVILNIQL